MQDSTALISLLRNYQDNTARTMGNQCGKLLRQLYKCQRNHNYSLANCEQRKPSEICHSSNFRTFQNICALCDSDYVCNRTIYENKCRLQLKTLPHRTTSNDIPFMLYAHLPFSATYDGNIQNYDLYNIMTSGNHLTTD